MPLEMKRCTLKGKNLRSLDDVYDALAEQLPLPGHFGRNLDALWDSLSGDVEGPFEILWEHAELSKKAMGKDFERLLQLLRELEEERDDFELVLAAGD